MVALIAGFVLGQSQDSVKSFNVGHLSVETLVTLLRDGQPGSLVPQGVKITLDQSSNSLIARGSESKLEELGRILATFDVEPRKLKISALVTWSQLGKEWTSEATVYSGESWSMGDRDSAFYLTAKPRLSGPNKARIDFELHQGANIVKFQSWEPLDSVIVFDGMEAWATPKVGELASYVTQRRENRKALWRRDATESLGIRVALKADVLYSK